MRQTVWITGGARGIGAATVRTFAQAGWRVAFSYRQSTQQAQVLAEQTGALALRADMTDRTAVQGCMQQFYW